MLPLFTLLLLSAATDAQKNFIFLLAGQSNISGRGGVIRNRWDHLTPPECQPIPDIPRLSASIVPIHPEIDVYGTRGLGPSMSFEHTVLATGGVLVPVRLVPCTVGATPIREWARWTTLYLNLGRRKCVATAEREKVAAVRWYQGESDAIFMADAEAYGGRMDALVSNLRRDLRDPDLLFIQEMVLVLFFLLTAVAISGGSPLYNMLTYGAKGAITNKELIIVLFLYLTTVAIAEGSPTYNVMAYGAKGDGITDDSKAFLNAWKAACADPRNPYFVVTGRGGKNYLLSKIIFEGPCQSSLKFLISGGLVAPTRLWTNKIDTWIIFKNVPRITVLGDGLIDGKGSIWWDCLSKNQCKYAPYIMEFMGCDHLRVMDLNLKDSPGKHLVVYKSDYAMLSGLRISSPENSPNTDGILISDSQHGIISYSTIGVGDDCIAIGPRSYDINVSHITCGPGHGISIGSLGKYGVEDNVEGIHISNSYIFNTLTGIRIKTWQGGAGHAKFISYENINFTSVKGGVIVIDQYYCPELNCPNKTGNVAISDVSYFGLQGSSVSDVAIKLACSSSMPCRDITMSEVSFTPKQANSRLQSYCVNAQGSESGFVSPHSPCLKHNLIL